MVPTESLRSDLFEAAFTHSAIGMALVGLDGTWLEANKALCAILGYAKEELRTLTFQDITHVDDLDADLMQAKRLLYGEIDTYRMEKRYLCKDSTWKWAQLTGSLARDESGAPDFFIAQIVDLSVQKQIQAAQNAFFELSPSLLCICREDGYLIETSVAWSATLGWSRTELLSRPLFEFVHPDDLPRTKHALTAVLAGTNVNGFTNRYRHKDGSYRWLQWNAQINDKRAIFAMATDVTSQQRGGEVRTERRGWDQTTERRSEPTASTPALNIRQLAGQTFESSTDCVKILDLNGSVLAMNKRGQCLMEVDSFDTVAGVSWCSLWPQPQRERVAAAIEQARHATPTSFVVFRPTAKGMPKWWDIAVAPILAEDGAVQAILSVSRDVTAIKEESIASERAETISRGQRQILEQVVAGASLPHVLDELAKTAQTFSMGKIRTSILLLDDDGQHLRLAAAPSFPDGYKEALACIPISDNAGSCALAVSRKRPVFVRDVLTDPIWASFRKLAHTYQLQSCWSQPILSSKGVVLGTFAFYFPATDEPGTDDLQTMMILVNTASLILERNLATRATIQAKADLRKSTAKFERLVESGILGILHYRADGSVLNANDAFLKIAGLSRARFEQDGLSCHAITPEDWVEIDQAAWARLARDGVLAPFEKEYLRPDGSRAAVYIGAAAFEDNPEEGIAYILDISGLKHTEKALMESEAKFRTITNAMPQMVWATEPDGSHTYFNDQWYAVTGVPVGSTEGDGWINLFHPDDVDRTQRRWAHSLATGEPYEIEYRLRQHTGEYRWTLGRALPVRNESGTIIRWMGTCTDIHEQKTAQETLEHADHRRNEFLAMLAHELRNPLTPITSAAQYLGLAVGGLDADKVQRISGVILRQTQHMTGLIDDLLDVSRVSSGVIRLDRQPVNMVRVIQEAMEQLTPTIEVVDHRVQLNVLTDEPILVSGDRMRLVQVVVNLIGNAVKYTPRGGLINVVATVDPYQAMLTVKDNGIGMSDELVRHAFELFTQGERSTDRTSGGLGIGLALVKSLVGLHDGTVTAASEGPGLGSTFVVMLPRLRDHTTES